MPKVINREAFVIAAKEVLGQDVEVLTRQQIIEIVNKKNISFPNWLTGSKEFRHSRGSYILPNNLTSSVVKIKEDPSRTDVVLTDDEIEKLSSFVPTKLSGYVEFGHFKDVRDIIASGKFFPTYVTGLSGNGKTLMIEQACAKNKRECVRVNITRETDEDDLLGGFRLINGETVWHDGPVITAMKNGAILLLDEVDLGDAKLMCLQPILEGRPIFLKKIKTLVAPKAGFNIFATANTKGRGSEDGRFIGTNIMNEAFLERFSITFEQEYPDEKIEKEILRPILGKENEDFTDYLVKWAAIIRKTFAEGGTNEVISTRRLVHIAEAFIIFGNNKSKAIKACLNRFDVSTKEEFYKSYTKVDPDPNSINKRKNDRSLDEILGEKKEKKLYSF